MTRIGDVVRLLAGRIAEAALELWRAPRAIMA
jgi:hypothetical protein